MTAAESEPLSGIEITTDRHQSITEIATASLRVSEYVDEIHLDDLRRLVEAAADIPGSAIVHPRADGIDITYSITQDILAAAAPQAAAPLVHIEDWHTNADNQAAARVVARRELADAPAASRAEASATNGDSTPVEEVRRVVELIKQATDMSTGAIADMVDIPRTSLVSLMAPSYKSRTTRRSTLDKLQSVLDELAAEGAEPTVDGPEDFTADRERDEQIGVAG